MWRDTVIKMWKDGKEKSFMTEYTLKEFPNLTREQAGQLDKDGLGDRGWKLRYGLEGRVG